MFLPQCYESIAREVIAARQQQSAERLARKHSPEIRILLVSKYQSRADIRSVLDYFRQRQLSGSSAGTIDPTALSCPNLGENYVQGAAQRLQELQHYQSALSAEPQGTQPFAIPELEMIGPLQSNKAARACEIFSTLHSVSSAKLLRTLAKALARQDGTQGRAKPLSIFFQYNASAEEQKSGCRNYDELRLLLDEFLLLDAPLLLRGLMCMSVANSSSDLKRRTFADCRWQAERLWREYAAAGGDSQTAAKLIPHFELSMGMSGDYLEALAEGANVLRIGGLLFQEDTDSSCK